jgi:hypothetical protein
MAGRAKPRETAVAFAPVPLAPTDLGGLSRRRLKAMLQGGAEALECIQALQNGGENLVGDLLRGQGTFYEWSHYPEGDVYDRDSHAQYYYHTHDATAGEHGHFHTFLRATGMPDGIRPVLGRNAAERPAGDDALSHLVAIAMDAYGMPVRLFATNRWVTGETWYAAPDVVRMLDRFRIDHAVPSWPVNRWLTAMFRLFHPEIEALVRQRDEVVSAWARRYPEGNPLEDTALEVTGSIAISIAQQIDRIKLALAAAA